jgi:hypothetical protein
VGKGLLALRAGGNLTWREPASDHTHLFLIIQGIGNQRAEGKRWMADGPGPESILKQLGIGLLKSFILEIF